MLVKIFERLANAIILGGIHYYSLLHGETTLTDNTQSLYRGKNSDRIREKVDTYHL